MSRVCELCASEGCEECSHIDEDDDRRLTDETYESNIHIRFDEYGFEVKAK